MDTSLPTFRRLLGTRIRLPFAWPFYTTAAQRRGLLRVIAVGIEEKLPLVPLLSAWAEDERGAQRNRVERLVSLMDDGASIADAVEQVPGLLRDEDILAIRFDAQSGTVTTAVREALGEPTSAEHERSARSRSSIMYLWMVLIIGLPIVIFIATRIVPAFRQIYREFNMELPAVSESFVRFIGVFDGFSGLVILAFVVVLLSVLFTRAGRGPRREISRVVGPLSARQSADLLRMVAIALNAGRPIAGALSTLARYHFDPTIRQKLLFVRNEMEQGANLWQSMNAVGLVTNADVRALDLAELVGNRPWVLTQLAHAKNRTATRRLDRISQLALPIAVLLIGLFVLFQAVALLGPMTHMIRALAA